MAAHILTADSLREYASYDPCTGIFVRKKSVSGKNGRAGSICGGLSFCGHIRMKVHRKEYFAHRLAWLYVHGEWPKQQIDHINGIKTDNRIENLRDVPSAVNTQNIKQPRRTNKTGFLGVHKVSRTTFRACIGHGGGPQLDLGTFTSAQDAHNAYLKAKRLLHEGCTI